MKNDAGNLPTPGLSDDDDQLYVVHKKVRVHRRVKPAKRVKL